MLNWFDLMRQAQGGMGLDNVSRQFGLTPEQTNAAVAALMPAFAMGLQRAATDPGSMAQLFRVMTGGHFPSFWESPSHAFTPQAQREGKHLLDQIFGSDEASRRVAHQAASFSGVGVDVLQQIMPLVAGIMAGGLARLATNQNAMMQSLASPPPAPSSGQTGAGAWADLWGQWMGIGTRLEQKTPEPKAPEPKPPEPEPRQDPPINAFEEMMASFLRPPGSAGSQARKPDLPTPEPPAPEPRQPEPPKAEAGNPFQAWGEMMEKGQEVQRQHLASLQAILDEVWKRGPERS
jgi:hypothetical protein